MFEGYALCSNIEERGAGKGGRGMEQETFPALTKGLVIRIRKNHLDTFR